MTHAILELSVYVSQNPFWVYYLHFLSMSLYIPIVQIEGKTAAEFLKLSGSDYRPL